MNVIEIRLKPEALAHYELPDILYPLPLESFDAALGDNGQLPFAAMLYQLQKQSRAGDADWQRLEPAMDRLAQLMAPDAPQPVLSATGDNWWLEVGPVDLGGPIITIQRGDKLIAALAATKDGRLRIAAYRPLDAKSATYAIGLGQKPHLDSGVCMRENNWEYALDCSAGNGNFYAYHRGEAYLSYWQSGLGSVADGTLDVHWYAMKDFSSRPAPVVVVELGIQYSFSEDGTEI